jgi:nitroreductase
MNTLESIAKRRSIRKFCDKEIDKSLLEKILAAGMLAPSAKNSQPWKYVVVTGSQKNEMIEALRKGLRNEKEGHGLFNKNPYIQPLLKGAEHTFEIMEEAAVTLFVINTENSVEIEHFPVMQTFEEKIAETVNIQSIGASIENILLAALEYGIGSLWIADIVFAYREISKWLNTDKEIIAAISLGYPDEDPPRRPRKEMAAVVEWK